MAKKAETRASTEVNITPETLKRGRKPLAAALDERPAINTEVVRHDLTASDVLSGQLMEIDATYGDGLPYDRNRLVNETRFLLSHSAEAMLEAGKRLVILKEHEPHGEFTEIIERRLNLEPRVARRMMQASLKFMDPKRQTLSVLGKGKLYELMLLDDDELDALADGGTVAGLEQDEVARMSVRELRAALRDAKEQTKVNDRQLESKDKKINELDAKLTGVKPKPEYDEAEALAELDKATLQAVGEIQAGMRKAILDLMGDRSALDLDRTCRQAVAAALGRVGLAVQDLSQDMGVAANEAEDASQGSDELDKIWKMTLADVGQGVAESNAN